MPRLADHEVRRKDIARATRAVIAEAGLDATTFQAVSAAAGVSVRLIQYYFGNKKQLLLDTHQALCAEAGNRLTQLWSALSPDTSPRAAISAVVAELLPLDATRRRDAVARTSFQAAALTGAPLVTDGTAAAPGAVAALFADQLQRAREDGQAPAVDPAADAELLLAVVDGLAQGMLNGRHTTESAMKLAEHVLDLLLGNPATHRYKYRGPAVHGTSWSRPVPGR